MAGQAQIQNASPRGLFITLEGTEGAGKSTLIAYLAEMLQKQGHEVLLLREPGGTEAGEKIRGILKSPYLSEPLLPETELLLMYASRVQLVKTRIIPALERGVMVLCDRHDLSSFAYQGGGRGLPLETIKAVRRAVLGDFRPDLTLLLDLPVEVGMARVSQRGAKDRFELEKLDFFKRVRAAYLEVAAQLDYVKVIDGAQSPEQVRKVAVAALESLFLPDNAYNGL